MTKHVADSNRRSRASLPRRPREAEQAVAVDTRERQRGVVADQVEARGRNVRRDLAKLGAPRRRSSVPLRSDEEEARLIHCVRGRGLVVAAHPHAVDLVGVDPVVRTADSAAQVDVKQHAAARS